jgi:hypothetical protein
MPTSHKKQKRRQNTEGSIDFASVRLGSWDEIHTFYKTHPETLWIFRGQKSAAWNLETSLERCAKRTGKSQGDAPKLEAELFREFRRVYHQFSKHIPSRNARLEWASIMQHHGAPTRLLDFTYSIYVAAYFALEHLENPKERHNPKKRMESNEADYNGVCAIWAVNWKWATERSVLLINKTHCDAHAADLFLDPTTELHEKRADKLLFREPYTKAAALLTPFRLNERLRAQRGTFLVPGNISVGFIDNLKALDGHDNRQNVLKIEIPWKERAAAIRNLAAMNISRTTLFPGLDGYAQCLGVYHPSFEL